MRRMKVLFVAGLTRNRPEVVGGQLTAALTLMDSGIKEHVEFIPVDSTKMNVPSSPFLRRTGTAAARLIRFARHLPEADVALIFTADGLSLVEKSLMCAMARLAGRGVVLRPSSGGVIAQCRSNPFIRWALRLGFRNANAVCAQSRTWLDFFRDFPEAGGKVYEVPNPVVLHPLPAETKPARRPPRLAYCGAITRNKGVFESLQVIQKVRADFPECKLVLAGHGGDAPALAAAAAAAGLSNAIELRGPVSREEVFSLLRDSDVFLFPSHYEGMPNAVLEAMSFGVPVVTTRVGGLNDLIQSGENGFALEVNDVNGMSAAVVSLLSDPARARDIGRRGWQTISDRHDVEKVWRIFARLLCRAAYESGRRLAILYEPFALAESPRAAGDWE